jgi:hypothetical protein
MEELAELNTRETVRKITFGRSGNHLANHYDFPSPLSCALGSSKDCAF